MKLYEIREFSQILSAATLADPFLALCSVTAWLDPLSAPFESFIDEAYYGDGGDDWSTIGVAWEVARSCFPEVYAETTPALRTATDERRLADQLCTGINSHLVGGELCDLDQIHFGVPFFGRGVDILEPEFFADPEHARLLEAYKLLDLDVDADESYGHPDGYTESAQAADVLAFSLRQTGDETYEKVAWLLDWLFSQTGNSVADHTDEDIYEMGLQPLMWEPGDLEFNRLMHEEADEIIADAFQGLEVLLNDESLQAELRANFTTVSRRLRKVKQNDRYQRHAERLSRGLRWPERRDAAHEQRPADDTQNLSVRGADAA